MPAFVISIATVQFELTDDPTPADPVGEVEVTQRRTERPACVHREPAIVRGQNDAVIIHNQPVEIDGDDKSPGPVTIKR